MVMIVLRSNLESGQSFPIVISLVRYNYFGFRSLNPALIRQEHGIGLSVPSNEPAVVRSSSRAFVGGITRVMPLVDGSTRSRSWRPAPSRRRRPASRQLVAAINPFWGWKWARTKE